MKTKTCKFVLLATMSALMAGCNADPSVMIGQDGHKHNFEFVQGTVPTNCGQSGMHNYYTCTDCNLLFDENHNIVKFADLKYSLPHTLSHVDGVSSTFQSEGVLEHYHCSSCGKNFSDKKGTIELASTVEAKKSNYLMDEIKTYRNDFSLYEITETEEKLTLKDNECKANGFVFLPAAKNLFYFRASVEIEWEVAESFGINVANNTRNVLCGLIPYDNINFIRYSYGSKTDFNRSHYKGSAEQLNELGAGIESLPGGRKKATITVFRDESGLRLYCGHYLVWKYGYKEDIESIGADDMVRVGIMYRPNRYSFGNIVETVDDGLSTFTCLYNDETSAPVTFTGKYNAGKTEISELSKTSNGKTVTIDEKGMFSFDGKATGFFAYERNQDGSFKKDVGYSCSYSNFKVEEIIRS